MMLIKNFLENDNVFLKEPILYKNNIKSLNKVKMIFITRKNYNFVKKKRKRFIIQLKNNFGEEKRIKVEDIEKSLFRDFKRYLQLKKDNQVIKPILERNKYLWDSFLNSSVFKYNGKIYDFKKYNQLLMQFLFDIEDFNELYELFKNDSDNWHWKKNSNEKRKEEKI